MFKYVYTQTDLQENIKEIYFSLLVLNKIAVC